MKSDIIDLHVNQNNLNEFLLNIDKLTNLHSLYLNNTDLTEIPEKIYTLTNLYILDISGNHFININDDIVNLINLRELNISNNLLYNLSDRIGEMNELRSLDISKNVISVIPNTILNLKQLINLDISSNYNIDNLPDRIDNLRQLRLIDISETNINILPDSIFNIPNLDIIVHHNIPPVPITVLRPYLNDLTEYLRQHPLTQDEYDQEYEEGETPMGIAYEIHNLFHNFNKNKYRELLNKIIPNDYILPIRLIEDELYPIDKLENIITILYYIIDSSDLDDNSKIEISNERQLGRLFYKLGIYGDYILDIDKETYQMIILTLTLLIYINNPTLYRLYITNFVYTSLNAYSGEGDTLSCSKGIIERLILSFTELLKDTNGICKNNQIDKLDLLCNEYYKLKIDKQEINRYIQMWYSLEDDRYNKLKNAKDRKDNLLQYLFKNYISKLYTENSRKDVYQAIEDIIQEYHFECNMKEDLFLGCAKKEGKKINKKSRRNIKNNKKKSKKNNR